MQDKLQKILNESKIVPIEGFSNLMFQRVERKIKLIMRVRFYFYSTVSVLSVVSLYSALPVIYLEITSSWVGNVMSLIFSESITSLSVIWKDVAYMLIESVPVMSLMILCGVIFVFTLSIREALIYKKKIYERTF